MQRTGIEIFLSEGLSHKLWPLFAFPMNPPTKVFPSNLDCVQNRSSLSSLSTLFASPIFLLRVEGRKGRSCHCQARNTPIFKTPLFSKTKHSYFQITSIFKNETLLFSKHSYFQKQNTPIFKTLLFSKTKHSYFQNAPTKHSYFQNTSIFFAKRLYFFHA
jgi:hypothetical protein